MAKQQIRTTYREYERLHTRLNPVETPEPEPENSQNTRIEQIQEEIFTLGEEETNEITRYLAEPRISQKEDPLDWWKKANYGALKLMARDYLGTLASSAYLEGEFARISDTTNPRKRNRLTKQRIREIALVRSWKRIKFIETPVEEDQSDDSDYPPSVRDQSESESGTDTDDD